MHIELKTRRATEADLPMLHEWTEAEKRLERQDYRTTIVKIVEADGEPVGFVSARLVWQVEPLYLRRDWVKKMGRSRRHVVRRAAYMLGRSIEDWLADRKNNPVVRSYFATVLNRTFCGLVESFGMFRLYPRCRIYGKDLP
jgi:hypothetical protein